MTNNTRKQLSASRRAAARWQLGIPTGGLAERDHAGLQPARTGPGGEYVITGVVTGARTRPRARRSVWRTGRFWLTATAGLAAATVVVGVVWLVVLVIAALVAAVTAVVSAIAAVFAWVAAHWVWIALVAGGLLLLAGGSRGRHCRGCRR